MRLHRYLGLGLTASVILGLTAVTAQEKSKSKKSVLPMQVVQSLVCLDVESQGSLLAPVGEAESFSTSERRITGYTRFQHVLKKHRVQWRWYDPDGNLYAESSEYQVNPTGKYHEYFTGAHAILVRGERATLLPGDWKLVVVLDGAIASTVDFKLTSGGA